MQKQCLNDNCYNITKQLSKKLEFLYHANRYIEDAKKAGDSEAEKTWSTIRSDEQKHADMLHDLLASEVKNNKF
jgi:rubrerythrin